MNKIVIFGNGNDWCEKSLNDFKKYENVRIINSKYCWNLKGLSGKIAKFHFSHKVNSIIRLPFKDMWRNKIVKELNEKKDSDIIFIIYDRNLMANNEKFLKYLRKTYKNCKLVYMFTNIASLSGASENNFLDKLSKFYDIVYAFDPADAKKYNFKYSPLIYSANYMDVDNNNKVFYVGKAKDRYSMLIEVFKRLKKLNIENKFYIFGVSEEEQKYKDEIKYNKYLTYGECLKNIQESNCILDIIQGNSEGFTIKTCEAVFYDKLLITTNKNIKNMPFYDERYMLVIESPNDIKQEFFENVKNVKYSEEGKSYFSVETFLNRLYEDLKKINNMTTVNERR